MEQFFIKSLNVNKVRHLQDIEINISEHEKNHLILTGKNGCGKTSLLEVLNKDLRNVKGVQIVKGLIEENKKNLEIEKSNTEIEYIKLNILKLKAQLPIDFNLSGYAEKSLYFYQSSRKLVVNKSQGVKDKVTEKVEDFEKFLAKKRTEQAFLSFESGSKKEVEDITKWFNHLEKNLQFLFEEDSLRLVNRRNEDKLNFFLTIEGREEFDFNTLSSGYSSVLLILFDMMQQMQNEGESFDYNKEGIALIDEVEAHLHISLQKKILPFLTSFFPNVQFIVTTHSPFILQSIKNAVIFDLETKKRYEDFSNYSSESILETFYDMDKFSDIMKKEMDDYESMLTNSNGKQKKEILAMRENFMKIPDIEISFWIKDMDIKYKDKVKQFLA